MSNLIQKKVCNAFLKDVSPSNMLNEYMASSEKSSKAGLVIAGFKKSMGGLWVGGNASLFEDRLEFAPNAVNKALHSGDTSWILPLAALEEATVSFGFITKIINLKTPNGTLRLRCFGAKEFCEQIQSQSKKVLS
jgi:hypothetical protein